MASASTSRATETTVSHALDRGVPGCIYRSQNGTDHSTSSCVAKLRSKFDQHFEVVTDACDVPPAIGGVLLQNDHPIAFYSRKLSGAELNYSATDKEMLGVIAALREWRCFLEGKPFTLITDHNPNTYVDTASNVHTMCRRARWLEESSGFDYTWRSRAGRINVADPISRAPQQFNSVLPMQLASIGDMLLVCQAPMATPGPLSGCSPDSVSGGCANPCNTSHSAAEAHAPSTEAARGPAALGDALGQVATRTSRKRRAVSLKRGDDSPEMCRKGRLGGEADREQNTLPAQGQPIPVHKEDQLIVQEEIEKVFIDRVSIGYERDSNLSKESFDDGTYRRDKTGLYWTDKEQLVITNYDNLREEVIHPVKSVYRVDTLFSEVIVVWNTCRALWGSSDTEEGTRGVLFQVIYTRTVITN
jgi:hypothetical protein